MIINDTSGERYEQRGPKHEACRGTLDNACPGIYLQERALDSHFLV